MVELHKRWSGGAEHAQQINERGINFHQIAAEFVKGTD